MPGGAEVHGSSNGVSNGAASATPKGAARFDASRLALLKSRLGEFVERGDLPGLSFVLGCDGEDVMRECIGMFDVEKKVPLTEDAIFRVMSMTKPIAAVAIMMLVEEARFSLNTPVSTFIPEFATLKVFVKENADGSIETEPLKEPMTIRHLITHTNGTPFGYLPMEPTDRMYNEHRAKTAAELGRPKTGADVMADLCAVPLAFQPGTRWKYGEGINVLGRIVEIVSGKSLGQFLQDRLFGPLGMVDTAFHCPPEKRHRLMPIYGHKVDPKTFDKVPGTPLEQRAEYGPMFAVPESEPAFCAGSGGLVSTLGDYALFCKMMCNGGELNGHRFLSPRTVALWSQNHAPEAALPWGFVGQPKNIGQGYSLATAVITDEAGLGFGCRKGSYTWGGAWTTTMWIDPVSKLYGVFMTHHETCRWMRPGTDMEMLTYAALVVD